MKAKQAKVGAAWEPQGLDQALDHIELDEAADGAALPQPTAQPTDEEIARRAYQIWSLNGYPDGTADMDWFVAAEELKGRLQQRGNQ